MSRPLRFIPENSLVEVTTRTFQGRLLLKPSAELTDIILGIIGKAQALYGMTVHTFVFLSTHAHFLVSARRHCPCPVAAERTSSRYGQSTRARHA